MNAQRSHIEASLDAHPKYSHLLLFIELDELAIVDGANTQVSLDGRDHRRTLKDRTRQRLQRLLNFLHIIDGRVKTHNADVLFASALLRLGQSSRSIDAHDQRAGHFGIERARMAGLLHAQYALDPSHYFVR